MEKEIRETILCPNGHDNAPENMECSKCGLPVIDWEMAMSTLIERLADKSGFAVPHIGGSFIGIGTTGAEITTNLCNFFGEDMSGVSFLTIDSMARSKTDAASEVITRGVRFYHYAIGDTSVGGSIYCGLGEDAASHDDHLESYLHMSGIRSEDTSQTVFITAAGGGGTGSGVGPVMVNLCRLCNQDVSTIATFIIPSSNEADHSHLNAFYGVSRMLTSGGKTNADMLLLLNYDKLRHIRGVGRSGKEFKADEIVSYLLWLFHLNLHHSGIIRMCRLSRGSKIQVFVPCVAIGRSIEIFGNLANILESAAAYPLAEINFKNVMASYLLVKIPRLIADNFPDETVSEEFEKWNKKYIPNMSSSLVQIIHTDERSDRIDVCILLGGANAGEILKDTISGYRRFKASMRDSTQWEEYGLSENDISEAEQVIESYDRFMDELREIKSG